MAGAWHVSRTDRVTRFSTELIRKDSCSTVSYYVVKPPKRASLARLILVGVAVLVAALALAAGWAAWRPVSLSVDGVTRRVAAGTTVADLHDEGYLLAPHGRLIAINGHVVSETGGGVPEVSRNGKSAGDLTRLYPGDVVVSFRGHDETESVETTNLPIPFGTKYEGDGPLTEMKTLGAPGYRRVQRGVASGLEITSTVVVKPTDTVISRFRPKGKVVALTFDDGPWAGSTDKILDVLAEENVKATFFMLGRQAKKHPQLAKRVAAEGHAVGTHTYDHRSLAALSAKGIRADVEKGRACVEAASGCSAPLLRPPYGKMDAQAWSELRRMNVTAVMWDVDSRDWTKPGIKKLRNNVLKHVKPGSVVLFHDGGGDRTQTIKALPYIIHKLRARGYTFVTVEQLRTLKADAVKREKKAKKAKG